MGIYNRKIRCILLVELIGMHFFQTALSYACSNGFNRVVEFLSQQPHIDLNKADTEGNTPLHYSAQAGKFKFLIGFFINMIMTQKLHSLHMYHLH